MSKGPAINFFQHTHLSFDIFYATGGIKEISAEEKGGK
jgi:hypothetical protein